MYWRSVLDTSLLRCNAKTVHNLVILWMIKIFNQFTSTCNNRLQNSFNKFYVTQGSGAFCNNLFRAYIIILCLVLNVEQSIIVSL